MPPHNHEGKTLVGEMVTDGEYYDEARAIEASVTRDVAESTSHFDMMAVIDKALAGVEIDENYRKGMQIGFADQSSDGSIWGMIHTQVRKGASFKLLRVHRTGNQHAALFRYKKGSQFNYYDLKLSKGANGDVRVCDSYLLSHGELMSMTVRQTLLPEAAAANPQLANRLSPNENEFLSHCSKINDFRDVYGTRDLTKIRELVNGLPESMQQSKMILLMRLKLATEFKLWEEVHAAARQYRTVYPGDDAIDLNSLNSMIIEKKYDEALAAVDRIDKLVGGDPELNKFRENIATLKAQK